jgi:transposase
VLQKYQDRLTIYSASTRKGGITVRSLVSDELCARIEPRIPKRQLPIENGGRPPVNDRAARSGISFVLKSDIPGDECGCGMTCWRWLRDWQAAGLWVQPHKTLFAELNAEGKINSSRAVGDREETGTNTTDRRKLGTKHHVVVDGNGVPVQV